MKTKKCKICAKPFEPFKFAQVVCGWLCAIDYGLVLKAKKAKLDAKTQRAEHKAIKQSQKTLTDWLKEAQRHCNRYVRLRDSNEPCISCGTVNPNIKYDAGHYRTSKAAPQLRFNLDNIHKQCSNNCNVHLSGNIINYRPRLIEKIGIERVEALENNNEIKRYTIEDAKEISKKFRVMCKELEAAKSDMR